MLFVGKLQPAETLCSPCYNLVNTDTASLYSLMYRHCNKDNVVVSPCCADLTPKETNQDA